MKGSDQSGIRPVVIISGNAMSQDSEVLTFQVRTLASARLIRKIGEISKDELNVIKTGLMEILTY
ncbi:MAG: type II toxin-antitoxin system PemK/MazF family toxin [Bacteroidales bacterium]